MVKGNFCSKILSSESSTEKCMIHIIFLVHTAIYYFGNYICKEKW